MAISGQQPINIGQPNSPANSDSLYTAFNTVQNNFTTLFNAASQISSISSGNGINVSNIGGTAFKITNTGVTSITAGNNIIITTLGGNPGNAGALVISSTASGNGGSGGTVTSVGVQSNSNTLVVTNSPVISSGNINIDLPSFPNVAGSWRNPNVVVDNQGRITSIANGSSTGAVTSVTVTAGPGIRVSGSPITTANLGVGTIDIVNTGVTSLIAGTGIVLSGSNGAVTVSSTGGGNGGGGTVTRVGIQTTGNNLSVGGVVTSDGNLSVNLSPNISINSANITTITSNVVNADRFSAITVDNSNVVTAGLLVTSISTSTTAVGTVFSRRARGSAAAPAPAQPNDQLLALDAAGRTAFGNYQYAGGLSIEQVSNATSSNSYVPSRAVIASTDSNTIHRLVLTSAGNLEVPGSIINTVYSNVPLSTTSITGRAGGTAEAPANIASGDSVFRSLFYGLTGNGSTTIKGQAGFSFSSGIIARADADAPSPGAFIPSTLFFTVANTTGVTINASLTSTGNFNIPSANGGLGSYNGNGSGLFDIVGANVTGSVANAVYANTAGTANSANTANTANTANSANTANTALSAGTVTTSAQPNITSVGTLTSLNVSGVSTLNAVGNVKITGGSNGQVLTTDGTGNLRFASTSGVPGGANAQVQFNNNGAFAGDADFTYNSSTNILTVGNLTVSGNIIGNLVPAANVTYNLGSPTQRWKDLYLSNNTIYIANQSISTLSANGITGISMSNVITDTAVANTIVVYDTLSLGDISTLEAEGGSNGDVLMTNGLGNLYWGTPTLQTITSVPEMSFVAASNANNQTFSNVYFLNYQTAADCTVFRNGALLDSGFYTLAGNTMTITTPLTTGDSINVIRQFAANGFVALPVGSNTEIQFNDDGASGASANLTFDKITGTLSVPSISINQPATANTVATVVATVPIIINGVTYKLMLSQ